MKAETWCKPYGGRPDKHQQAKKLGLLEAQKMIGTPANPDRSGGNAAKNAVLNLSRIKCRETAFKNRAS
ncbi:hypothetical protein KBY75_10205 [Cyanobium sp. T1G-Tous]|uniref:hypothetical protein n=1 Tax=Cyanobium sp. T1G-Tous TaxID=2823722 RepID=UPI0020CF3B81|nr:hypothetical protein [Cyanobium sp. T1G-Tous]MCP9803936.1 hypothetical protein [Cyanobium sp. T1G-Tous]